MSASPRLSALNMVDHSSGGSQLGVIAKRTYQIRAGRCVVAEEQVALVEAPVLSEDKAALLHDLDIVLNRTQTDVIVLGKVYAASGQTQLDATIRVGALERTLRVFGDRSVYRDHMQQLRFSDPNPLETVDLAWSSAYGGADLIACQKYGDPFEALSKHQRTPYEPRLGSIAYPRNRAGKGYLIDASAEGMAACCLPNLEDPACLLSPDRLPLGRADRWPAGPSAAATGFLAYHCFPRCAMLGLVPPYDFAAFPALSFAEVKSGLLNPKSIAERIALFERMDRGVAQGSAPGMRVAQLDPGAAVQLRNLHPGQPTFGFSLPVEAPRMMLKLPDAAQVELAPKIRCLLLEPDRDRLCVAWVGEHCEPTPVGPGKFAKVEHGVWW